MYRHLWKNYSDNHISVVKQDIDQRQQVWTKTIANKRYLKNPACDIICLLYYLVTVSID